MTTAFDQLADRILSGGAATAEDAVAVLRTPDTELMGVVAAAGRLRREHFGNTVKVNYLVNLKSGLCPENCNYCSQALGSQAPVRHDQSAHDAKSRRVGLLKERSRGLRKMRPKHQRRRSSM